MPHIWHALESMQRSNYTPRPFDPVSTECFELDFSAAALEELETSQYDRKKLSALAYSTYILGKSFRVPTESLSFSCNEAFEHYKEISQRLGYCDEQGHFFTAKIMPGLMILRTMTHPGATGIPNFFRAWFLLQLAHMVVLPKILAAMQENSSIRDFDTDIVEFYTHIAQVFIPNLFNILCSPAMHTTLPVLIYASKLLLEFPTVLFPQTIELIKRFNAHALQHLPNLTTMEIFEFLKLNEHAEVNHAQALLSPRNKTRIIRHLYSIHPQLSKDEILMLMQMKYTIFNNHHTVIIVFDGLFQARRNEKQNDFSRVTPIQHEIDLLAKVRGQLRPECEAYLVHSHVCPSTGKEIDIAYVHGRTKVAIHIDGADHHYYLDRQEQDRKTKIRNKALENAGWVNICQPLARTPEFLSAPRENYLIKESRELLDKLEGILPFKSSFTRTILSDDKITTRTLLFLDERDRKTFATLNYKAHSKVKTLSARLTIL